jgi:hypothetical protein
MERASALYRDELLTGLQISVEPFNDWLTLERQRLLSLRLDLLHRLAVAKAEARDMEGAIGAARHVTALDPLREEGHRLLMRLLASSGNRSAALKQHERCVQVLRDELGIAPEAETAQLAEAIRAGRSLAAEPTELPAIRPADKREAAPVPPRDGDVLHQPIDEVILARVARQIGERKDDDRGLVGQRRAGRGRPASRRTRGARSAHAKRAHACRDFEITLVRVSEARPGSRSRSPNVALASSNT